MARPSDLQAVCTRALQSVDAEFLDLARRHSLRAGSTVLCVLTRGAELCVFNVGDSRAVLARAPSSGDAAHPRAARGEPCLDAVRLSCDHSANLREEREAAQRRGAEVSRSGNDEDWRVVTYVESKGKAFKSSAATIAASAAAAAAIAKGAATTAKPSAATPSTRPPPRSKDAKPMRLAVTRALGDLPFKAPCQLVSCVPHVHARRLDSRDRFVILASDGLWDVLSDVEAV